jgi:serine/threonine protein kinase/Tol biopolymer transport system component
VIGQTISHYKITEKLGEGGMGVVYKAEDTNLKRPVALKFLAAHLLGDEGVKERFRREAEAAAALTHANIAVIHDINESDGHSFIAMEFVEGPTVGKKVGERPLKLEEALDIAIQAVQGLQAAHEKDIVHRDIKSANLMVAPQGAVKVMDFGLAQLAERSKLTKTTTILGTPSYMSPEQAVGDKTDRRTDLWSLGVVLYEMVTGRLPFEGERQEAVLYKIGSEEPEPVTALRAGLPMELEWIIGKALAKDRDERYQHAEDLLVDLRGLQKKLASGSSTILKTQAASQTGGAPSRSAEQIERQYRRKQTVLLGAAGLGVLLALVFAFFPLFSPAPLPTEEKHVTRFTLPVEELITTPTISPDGRHVAYSQGSRVPRELWVQDLNQDEPRVLTGTEATNGFPFWSPDSTFIAFFALEGLKVVPLTGGQPRIVCRLGGNTWGSGTWSPDGSSIFFAQESAVFEVSAQGGEPRLLFDSEDAMLVSFPHLLPPLDGRRQMLFVKGQTLVGGAIVKRDLETGKEEILARGMRAVYAASGYILYEGLASPGVWAMPFSPETLQATAEPFLVRQDAVGPSVGRDGTLVYQDATGTGAGQLKWLSRDGRRVGEIGQIQRNIRHPTLSPDGRRVVVQATERGNTDIWVHDTARPLKSRITFGPEVQLFPKWTPSGNEIVFTSLEGGAIDILRRSVDGSSEARKLVATELPEYPSDWTSDGAFFVYMTLHPTTGADIRYLKRNDDGDGFESHTLLATRFIEGMPRLSPDGRFVAYVSNESGQDEIYVRTFPQGGGKYQVSVNGGSQARWSRDGKELYFVAGDQLMATAVSSGETRFATGRPELLFRHASLNAYSSTNYDVAADGRFVVVDPVESKDDQMPRIHVVLNWHEEFRDREQD